MPRVTLRQHGRGCAARSCGPWPLQTKPRVPWARLRRRMCADSNSREGVSRHFAGWKAYSLAAGSPRHLSRSVQQASAASVSEASVSSQVSPAHDGLAQFKDRQANLAPLPDPPKSSGLLDVLPYLFKLALSDSTLLVRLMGAFTLMGISKSS
eukprot:scaffold91463_cov43-Prasinocladus_malaysianus.AAC.1